MYIPPVLLKKIFCDVLQERLLRCIISPGRVSFVYNLRPVRPVLKKKKITRSAFSLSLSQLVNERMVIAF